jgi:hypothetical protein
VANKVALFGLALVVLCALGPARAEERHAGYYYPPPKTQKTLPDSDRKRRLGFVTAMTAQMLSNPYPPPFAIFAKGDDAEKLIIVGLYENSYNTLYRMRGLLAMLTASARMTPFFNEVGVEDYFTFFDLAKLLGFTQITVSDGRDFAHRIDIK